MTLLEQRLAEVRAEKPGAAGHEGGRHRARSYPAAARQEAELTKSSRATEPRDWSASTRVVRSTGRVHGSPPQGPALAPRRRDPLDGGRRGRRRCVVDALGDRRSAHKGSDLPRNKFPNKSVRGGGAG